MKAAVIDGVRTIGLTDVELAPPAPGSDDRLVRISACGVCGSNVTNWRDPAFAIDASGGRQPGAAGHEISGVVEATGARVIVEPNRAGGCGTCAACSAGRAWFCRNRRPVPVWGFAEAMVVPSAAVFDVPGSVDPLTAVLIEPLSCTVHAIRHSWTAATAGGRVDGRRVAVLGAGLSGLLASAAARWLGAEQVAVLARHDHQAEWAERLGADVVVRDADDAAARSELKGFRPDLVVEAVGGASDTFGFAVDVVAAPGEISVLGLYDKPQQLDVRRAAVRETRLFFPITYGELGGVHDFEIAIDLVANAGLPLDGLVTHRFTLDEIAQAFETAADKSQGSLRVVVTP
jgi:2-desacetyl-2-hydroxyethyl bacteriochlorophyllide A dehydrogenase